MRIPAISRRMITSLRGTLLESAIFHAVVECAGVGYEVHIPVTTTEKLPPPGSEVRLHILHVIREDDQSLYGFASAEERDFFKMLVERVSGVGPRTALNIFSKLSLPVLKEALARGDVKLLASCPGIGKKTAERLVVELRDKVSAGVSARDGGAQTGPAALAGPAGGGAPSTQSDAVAALVSLGLKAVDADKAVRQAIEKLGAGAPIERLIRAALGNS
jgi:Holliday junction DNA helicase RuvA